MKTIPATKPMSSQGPVRVPLRKAPLPTPSAIRKSKAGPWRAGALVFLNLFMVAHVIQWWIAGRTISPIEPSESMQTLQKGAINAGFIFFTLAILGTMIFGRFVCGWGCHIVALQDFCGWLLKKMGITPKPFRSRLLIYVPLIAALYMFVWPTFYRLFLGADPGPIIPAFTNHLVTDDFWATFPSVAVAIPFLFICGFVTVYFMGMKGFCTYACPYGGFFVLADKVAPTKIRVTDACNQCGHCTTACTSNVTVHAEVKQYGMVVDPGCMKCMDCVSVCPTNALYLGFGKPSVAVPKSKAASPSYSLTWPEEIAAALIFLGSFLAVRAVYSLVPFLMALGCAAVSTFLALKTWQLFRRQAVTLHQFVLKDSGKIRTAGWALAAFAMIWLGLTIHSGWIRYHEYYGDRAFQKLQVPDELALAQLNPAPWLTPADRENIADGEHHLESARKFGLFVNRDALPKLAWFEYLDGRPERAIDLLGQATRYQKGQALALSLYYRGAILNRLGRYEEGKANLDQALATREDLVLARQEAGESLWQLGRKDEAIATWSDAVRQNASLALVSDFLAGAAQSMGQTDDGLAYQNQANQFTPEVPAYHWMIGLRLSNLHMNELAEAHFQRAIQLDPSFAAHRR